MLDQCSQAEKGARAGSPPLSLGGSWALALCPLSEQRIIFALVEVYSNMVTWLWPDLKNKWSHTKKSARTNHDSPPFPIKGLGWKLSGSWGFLRHKQLCMALQQTSLCSKPWRFGLVWPHLLWAHRLAFDNRFIPRVRWHTSHLEVSASWRAKCYISCWLFSKAAVLVGSVALYCFKILPCFPRCVLSGKNEAQVGFQSAGYVASLLDLCSSKALVRG